MCIVTAQYTRVKIAVHSAEGCCTVSSLIATDKMPMNKITLTFVFGVGGFTVKGRIFVLGFWPLLICQPESDVLLVVDKGATGCYTYFS